VIQTAFIGDAILVSSLLETLHKGFPCARIDLMVRKGNESLFSAHPFIGNILIWDKKKDKYSGLFRLFRQMRRERYDYLINVQRHWATGFFAAFSNAGYISGFRKNPLSFLFDRAAPHSTNPSKGVHEIHRNYQLIASITRQECEPIRLYPSAKDEEQVGKLKSQPYICISPASVWFTKQLPAVKWIELIHTLGNHYKIYLLGGPSDKKYCEEIRQNATSSQVENLAGSLGLLASAALMRDAVMNYVNDSAPLHLCSAVNASVTAVFCSTVPGFGFGPLSPNAHVVEVLQPLKCRPCGLHGKPFCPEKHFKCAFDIEIQQLLQPLKRN